jgi:D-hydroxyproline dehydrogenase subunit gamma
MDEPCRILVDGEPVAAVPGESLAVVLLRAGCFRFRTSCTGQGRGPLCAMGTCYECQVQVDGTWSRACLAPVRNGMEVRTHA